MPLQQSELSTLSTPVRRTRVISLNVSLGNYAHLQDWVIEAARHRESRSVCFANVHMVVEARRNAAIAQAVNSADWVAPDGVPLLWAMRGLYGLRQERIAGMDAISSLLQKAAEAGISAFFYGSTPDVLDEIRRICAREFPSLQIAGMVSPPFRPMTPAEETDVIDEITASGAGLVFVALGCPKQELWMARMRGRIPAVLLGIGGALPVLAGQQTRAPRWMQKIGTEWLFRLMQEPRRLFKRYTVTNSLYIYYFVRQFLNQQLSYDKVRN